MGIANNPGRARWTSDRSLGATVAGAEGIDVANCAGQQPRPCFCGWLFYHGTVVQKPTPILQRRSTAEAKSRTENMRPRCGEGRTRGNMPRIRLTARRVIAS